MEEIGSFDESVACSIQQHRLVGHVHTPVHCLFSTGPSIASYTQGPLPLVHTSFRCLSLTGVIHSIQQHRPAASYIDQSVDQSVTQ